METLLATHDCHSDRLHDLQRRPFLTSYSLSDALALPAQSGVAVFVIKEEGLLDRINAICHVRLHTASDSAQLHWSFELTGVMQGLFLDPATV